MIPVIRRALLLVTALVVAGCSGPVFKRPEVALNGVQVAGLGLRGGTLLVNLRVVNPNRFALSSEQLRYTLELRKPEQPGDTTWVRFAEGVYAEHFSVGARDTALVQVPVEFSYSSLGSAATSLLRSGTFDYRARGTVDVGTPIGTYDVPFLKKGTLSLMGAR